MAMLFYFTFLKEEMTFFKLLRYQKQFLFEDYFNSWILKNSNIYQNIKINYS